MVEAGRSTLEKVADDAWKVWRRRLMRNMGFLGVEDL